MDTIVITRHPALVRWLLDNMVIDESTEVFAHATPELVKGKDVIGVLPMRLAALTGRFREVTLEIPAEWRGKELTLEQFKQCNPCLTEYHVERIDYV